MKELDLDKIQSDPTLSYCLENFFGYASHAIQDKAIPHFFDGQLPTQRRYLLAMQDLKAFPGRKTIKSTVAGARMTGWYSPQGNGYGVLVNMSQPYKVPILLTDPEGNWGEQENFIPAAERYTETRLSKFAMESLLHDLSKGRLSSKVQPHNIVPTKTNWEGSLLEEEYLPARLPVLLINGSSGIAVGIAQTFQPLEYKSLLRELKRFIKKDKINYSNLRPGHPTNCACITSPEEFQAALETGDGSIRLAARFRTDGEGRGGRSKRIIITAVPPYTSFNAIGDKFNDWRRSDARCPFKSYRNESSNDEIRLVFEFKPGDMPKDSFGVQLAVQQLYKKLTLVTTATIKMIALKGNYPVQYNVQSFFIDWVEERSNIIQRISEGKAQYFGQEKHKYDLLKWVKMELEIIVPILEESESEQQIKNKINVHRVACNESKLIQGDMKILLGINLRQISKISEEELLSKSDLMEKKWGTHKFLSENEPARREQIIADIDYFLKNAKSLGVKKTYTDFDDTLATLLGTSVPTIRKTMKKPVNPFLEYLNKKSNVDIIIQTEAGFFTRLSIRSAKTIPMTPRLALASDTIAHATLFDREYLIFITNTGRFFNISKRDIPYNTPMHWSKILDLVKLSSDEVKSIYMVPVYSDSPTHVMFYLQDDSFKKVNISKLNSMRVSITLPSPIKQAGFIGNESIPIFQDGENTLSYLNPNEIKESYARKKSRFPKIMSLGTPTRILKGMVIKHEAKSIYKIIRT